MSRRDPRNANTFFWIGRSTSRHVSHANITDNPASASRTASRELPSSRMRPNASSG
jgi:hypothetical protein